MPLLSTAGKLCFEYLEYWLQIRKGLEGFGFGFGFGFGCFLGLRHHHEDTTHGIYGGYLDGTTLSTCCEASIGVFYEGIWDHTRYMKAFLGKERDGSLSAISSILYTFRTIVQD